MNKKGWTIMLRTVFTVLALGTIMMPGISALEPLRAAEGLVTFKVLSPELALKAATVTLQRCREDGYQVAVAVVDRFGVQQVMLRDRFAGPHTPSTATRKAWTAVSFRTNTVELGERIRDNQSIAGLQFVENALVLGGGLPIEAAGSMVGGIGVSGAPGGELDEACAQAGLDAIEDEIAF